MERPTRNAPKRDDPNFITLSPLNRQTKQLEQQIFAPKSAPKSGPKLAEGKVGSRRSSTRLSFDKPSSSEEARTQNVKPEKSSIGRSNDGPKTSRPRGRPRLCSRDVGQKGGRTITDIIEQETLKSDATNNISSTDKLSTVSASVGSCQVVAVEVHHAESDDVVVENSIVEDDDGEVTLNFSRSEDISKELEVDLNKTHKVTEQSNAHDLSHEQTKENNDAENSKEVKLSVKAWEKICEKLNESKQAKDSPRHIKADWFENSGSKGRSDESRKSDAEQIGISRREVVKDSKEGREVDAAELAGPSRKPQSARLNKCLSMRPVIMLEQLDPAEYIHLRSARQRTDRSPLKSQACERARIDGSKVRIMLERCDYLQSKPKVHSVGGAAKTTAKTEAPVVAVNSPVVKIVGLPVRAVRDVVTSTGFNTDNSFQVEELPVETSIHLVKIADEISISTGQENLVTKQPASIAQQPKKLPIKAEARLVKKVGQLVKTAKDAAKPARPVVRRRRRLDVFSSYMKKRYATKRQPVQKVAGLLRNNARNNMNKEMKSKVPTRVSTRRKRRSDVFAAYMARRTRTNQKLEEVIRRKSANLLPTRSLEVKDGRSGSETRLSGDDLLKKIKEEVDDQALYGQPQEKWSKNANGLCNDIAVEESVTMETRCHMGEIGQILLAPMSSAVAGVSSSNANLNNLESGDHGDQSCQEFFNENLCDKVDDVRGAVSVEFVGEIGTISLALQSDDSMEEPDDNVMEVSYADFISQDIRPSPATSKMKEKNKRSPTTKRGKSRTDLQGGNKRSPPPGGRKRKRHEAPSSVNKKRRCSLSGRAKAGATSSVKLKGKKLLKQAQMVKKQKGVEKAQAANRQRGCMNCKDVQCVARIVDGCAGGGTSARWYHISNGEHYCNKCFEYVYRKDRGSGEISKDYMEWRERWEKNSSRNGSIRIYMIDQIIPYWAQCSKCQKWRELPKDVKITAKFNRSFTCQKIIKGKAGVDPCSKREDPRVKLARNPDWFVDSPRFLILTESASAPFLVNYPPDDVGLSAFTYKRPKRISNNKDYKGKLPEEDHSDVDSDFDEGLQDPAIEGISDFLRPFHIPGGVFRAGTIEADKMDDDEKSAFPHHNKNPASQRIYITLRNLVLSLWNLNVKEWLTKNICVHQVICRGLMRIYCVNLLEEILSYLTVKGMINYGLVKPPQQLRVISSGAKVEHVLVIGAGPAGLSVAHQLNRFGIKVTVLETQSRIGGRVWDDTFAGTVIGRGAQLLNGCLNNPFAVMCQQLNIQTRDMTESCLLITEEGKVIPPGVDNKIDFHFDHMLENVAEWRDGVHLNKDVSLLEKLQEMHEMFITETGISFTEEEESVIQFHYSNLEYALGQDLSQISALNWDHNEAFSQFCGPHVIMEEGYSSILKKLAEKLHIKLNVHVKEIQYSDEEVKVIDDKDQELLGSKVVITVPLKVLQNNSIQFQPPLPKSKEKAIKSLGAGTVEKVAMAFPTKFWSKKVLNSDYFGHVPARSEERGLFSVFYDLSPTVNSPDDHVLVTFVSGNAMKLIENKTEKEIVEMCCEKLQKMFPEEKVPQPSKFFVTGWGQDGNVGMAYSYLGVGASADLYDTLSEEIDDVLFFGGEATNRQFPQSVTGAYLSGIREAEKILHSLAR